MLSDRIKKFGLQSNTAPAENADQAPENTAADRKDNGEAEAEEARRSLHEAFEKAESERSEAAEVYVAQRLEEAIHRPAPTSDTSSHEPAEGGQGGEKPDIDAESEEDDSDIPLLLRYSASLEKLRESKGAGGQRARRDRHIPGKKDTVEETADNGHAESKGGAAEEAVNASDAAEENNRDAAEENNRDSTVESAELKGVLTALGIPPESVETDVGDGDGKSESDGGQDNKDSSSGTKPSGVFNFGAMLSGIGMQSGNEASSDAEKASDTGGASAAEGTPSKSKLLRTKASTYAPLLAAAIQLLLIISSRISLSALSDRGNIYLSVVVIQLLIYVIPGIFYFKLRGEGTVDRLALKPTPPDRIYIAILAALLLFCISSGLKLAYMGLGIYRPRLAQFAAYINISSFSDPGDILYMVITFVFIPAVCEELIYRSIIMGEYVRDGYGTTVAAVASTVLFALLHPDIERLPFYLIMGAVMCVVVRITGSVLMSMVTGVVFGLCDILTENHIAALSHSDYKALIIFSVVSLFLLFAVLFFAEAERLYFVLGTSGEKPPARNRREGNVRDLLRSALRSPTVLVCCGIYIVGIVASLI